MSAGIFFDFYFLISLSLQNLQQNEDSLKNWIFSLKILYSKFDWVIDMVKCFKNWNISGLRVFEAESENIYNVYNSVCFKQNINLKRL